MAEPGEGPFDDPAFGEAFEALGARFTLHNLDLKGKVFRQFAQLFASIATIGPEPPQAREGRGYLGFLHLTSTLIWLR